MFNISSVRLACLVALFALAAICPGSPVLAQSAVTGAVGGSVSDPNGAIVSNATVTLRSQDTNKSETATSDSSGRFRFTNLQPGSYVLTIAATGFSEYKQERLVVEVGRLSNVDATLTVGAASATIDVVAEAPAVNLDSKEFTTNINQTAINELPIN